jgi:hypothetical protein
VEYTEEVIMKLTELQQRQLFTSFEKGKGQVTPADNQEVVAVGFSRRFW